MVKFPTSSPTAGCAGATPAASSPAAAEPPAEENPPQPVDLACRRAQEPRLRDVRPASTQAGLCPPNAAGLMQRAHDRTVPTRIEQQAERLLFEGELSQHPAVQQLAALRLHEPTIFEIIWQAILSLFAHVDPHADVRAHAERVLAGLDESLALLDAMQRDGEPDQQTLIAVLRALLPQTNPDIDPARLDAVAQVLGRHARVIAQNRVTRSTVPQPSSELPSRPLRVEATPYTQRDMTVDGMRLRYIDEGPLEQPARGTILLIHGHQSSVEEFTAIMPHLVQNYRVIAVDLPGSGYSEQPDMNYSLELYEQTLLHVLDTLGVDQAIPAGGSLGGNMALRLGRVAPERFPAVVSWSPAGVWPAGSNDAMAWAAENFYGGDLYWTILRYQSEHWFGQQMPDRQEAILETIRYRQEVDSPMFRRATAQIGAQQLRESHRGLGHLNSQPTLLMVGEQDHGLRLAENAIEFFDELPHGELEVFPEAGHSLHAERPQEVASRILRFLEEQLPAAAHSE